MILFLSDSVRTGSILYLQLYGTRMTRMLRLRGLVRVWFIFIEGTSVALMNNKLKLGTLIEEIYKILIISLISIICVAVTYIKKSALIRIIRLIRVPQKPLEQTVEVPFKPMPIQNYIVTLSLSLCDIVSSPHK